MYPTNRRQFGPSRKPSIELLERRAMLCDVLSSLSAGVLEVTGGDLGDTMALVMNLETDSIEVRGGGHTIASYAASQVESLRVLGNGGDDDITLDPRLDRPIQLDGGSGQDTVHGWAGPDRVLGGDAAALVVTGPNSSACIGIECFEDGSLAALELFEHGHDESARRSGFARSAQSPRDDAGTLVLSGDFDGQVAAHAAHGVASTFAVVDFGDSLLADSHTADGSAIDHADLAATPTSVSELDALAAVMDHAMDGSPTSDGSVARDDEFATRSPYQGECPSTSPMGLAAVQGAVVTGEASGDAVAAPKVGCKCLSMRAKAAATDEAIREAGFVPALAPAADAPAQSDSKSDRSLDEESCCARPPVKLDMADEAPITTEQPESSEHDRDESADAATATDAALSPRWQAVFASSLAALGAWQLQRTESRRRGRTRSSGTSELN